MELTENLISKIKQFIKTDEVHLDLNELRELQKYCRLTFKFSVDINCNDCVARHIRRVAKHLEID